jgi:hypothetical protein
MKSKMSKIVLSFAIISINILVLLSTVGCAGEIAEPVEIPAPLTTPEPESVPAANLSYIVVDTGQNKCYDNSREIACPQPGEAFYGQDAQYQGIQPNYMDNGDGTVTDLNTGLIWQKKPGVKVTYEEATAGAETLNLAGYDDWRLPTIKELYSLILFSGTDPHPERAIDGIPFLDTNYFDFEYGDVKAGERIIDAQYWSSTEYLGTTMNGNETVFGVNFADGRIKGYPRDIGPRGQPMTHFVRYVRGNSGYGINDFVDNGDGTITDHATCLMWAKADSSVGVDWEDALAWVHQKNEENYLGYNDWRLPNAKELQSIVDYTRSPQRTYTAAIAPVFEISMIIDERGAKNYPFYWTSTTHVGQTGEGVNAVYIAFGEALGYWMNAWMDVHGAGAQRSDPKSGAPDDYPYGRGPQGDSIRIYNFVRCVRDAGQ